MRKIRKLLTVIIIAFTALSLTAASDTCKVLLLVPAVGDKSYFDGAVSGMDEIRKAYSFVETEVKAMGRDPSVYESFFLDASESGDYDLIVTGGGECTEALLTAAESYPDQLFFDFDYQDTYGNELENVSGVYYRSSDMGYLAGYLASQITTSGMPGANEERIIGAVVGMDIPDMNDFVGSFCQAALDNDVRALIRYSDSFTDQGKAYEAAKAMYDEGCDVIWGVAGIAGLGVFEAAADTGHYSFGVDVDQTETVDDERLSGTIVTSFCKEYGKVILNAFRALLEGNFPGGTARELGLKERGVGLIENAQYKQMVPEDIKLSLNVMYDKVGRGEIVPYSVMENPEAWPLLKETAEKGQ